MRVVAATAVVLGVAGAAAVQRQKRRGALPRTAVYLPGGILPAVPSRNAQLERLHSETFDVIVVGGGATGASVALECASRGLRCALLEADDLCSGTSSKSTKLLHGGVRYLEAAVKEGDLSLLSLVWESLAERAHWAAAAPHLSRAASFLIPMRNWFQVPWIWTGAMTYQALAFISGGGREVPRARFLSPSAALARLPLLHPKGLRGALLYWDSSSNDSRLGASLALTAATPAWLDGQWEAAAVVTYCRVLDLLKGDQGEVVGVKAKDELTGKEMEVLGRVVVNAAGAGADVVRRMKDPKALAMMVSSVGAHVVLPHWVTPHGVGLLINKTSDDRVLFVVPWEGRALAGTTDEAAEFEAAPRATPSDVKWIIQETAKQLQIDPALLQQNTSSAWAGLRPLVRRPEDAGKQTAKLSRSHVVLAEQELVSLIGGKWTTARKMAEDCVNEILHKNIGGICSARVGPVRTKNMRLKGAIDRRNAGLSSQEQSAVSFPPDLLAAGLTDEQARHLWYNYGYDAHEVVRIGRETGTLQPLLSPELSSRPPPITPSPEPAGLTGPELKLKTEQQVTLNAYLEAEILYAARHELAERATDVLARRLRLPFLDAKVAKKIVPRVVTLMAKEKGWDTRRQKLEEMLANDFCDRMDVS